jgi:hypothetical protein
MEGLTPEETAMLAEIFILRLEAMLRALEQADRAKNYRFVPLSDNMPRDRRRVPFRVPLPDVVLRAGR